MRILPAKIEKILAFTVH